VIPAAAAIISAIEHALDAFGIHITETPISPARILEMLNSVSSAPTAPTARMRSTSGQASAAASPPESARS
jgi:hypothetical protein